MALIGSDGKEVRDEAAPKIEFPCDNYPVKVVGKVDGNYKNLILEIFDVHAPGYDLEKVQVRDSSKGTFQSVTVYILATGKPQLEALHKALMANELVRMVI